MGKSTVTRILLKSLLTGFAPILDSDPSAIPLVSVEAYANGESRHGFKGLFEDMRDQLLEPGADRKCLVDVVDGRMVVKPQEKATTAALRKVVESGLRHRKTLVCVIDEAYHLLRFGKDTAVMDTLKSLANTTGVKLVLVGSFDLFDLISDHGQVARRTSILNLDRYHLDARADRDEFKRVITMLMAKWPCEEVPNFAAISDDLLEVSLGCVGLLKSLMLDASAMQLRNGGKWDNQFLKKAAKSNALRKVISKEIAAGEAKVRDALVGDSLWDDKAFTALQCRMGDTNG